MHRYSRHYSYSTFSFAGAVRAGFFAHELKKLLFGGGDFAFFRGDGDCFALRGALRFALPGALPGALAAAPRRAFASAPL